MSNRFAIQGWFYSQIAQSLGAIGLILLFGCYGTGLNRAFAADEEEEIPEPVIGTLETKDGLNLKYTYFPSIKGKLAVPVIMLHSQGGNRNDYATLAKSLQALGHAVLVPDLRGHGGSTKFLNGNPLKIGEIRDTERNAVYGGMPRDIEACKKFLMDENNAGKVNIEMLCVVAAEESTVLALNWAVADWAIESRPRIKLGQDVKALVLLSPQAKIEKTAITTVAALKAPIVQKGLSLLIACGEEDHKSNLEAKKIYDGCRRIRGEPADNAKDLFFVQCNTKLQGTKLLNPRVKPPIEEVIAGFIDKRLVKQKNFLKWEDRTIPF